MTRYKGNPLKGIHSRDAGAREFFDGHSASDETRKPPLDEHRNAERIFRLWPKPGGSYRDALESIATEIILDGGHAEIESQVAAFADAIRERGLVANRFVPGAGAFFSGRQYRQPLDAFLARFDDPQKNARPKLSGPRLFVGWNPTQEENKMTTKIEINPEARSTKAAVAAFQSTGAVWIVGKNSAEIATQVCRLAGGFPNLQGISWFEISTALDNLRDDEHWVTADKLRKRLALPVYGVGEIADPRLNRLVAGFLLARHADGLRLVFGSAIKGDQLAFLLGDDANALLAGIPIQTVNADECLWFAF